jgi:hypothetical protein
MKKTIITLVALLGLTTSSWASNGKIEPEPLPNNDWFENYGRSLADRAAQLEFQGPEQVCNIILSQAQKASGGSIPSLKNYAQHAAQAFDNRLKEIYGAKDTGAEDSGAKDTGAKDPYIEGLLERYGASDKQLASKRTDTIKGFTGEPEEVIEITEGSPWVANYPSGSFLHNRFQVKNRKGAVESSETFNAQNPQNRESIKQQFIQKLEKAGWQYLDGDRMRWKGP